MSVQPISVKHIFGLKGDVASNVHHVDETTVIYPSGHNIVLYCTDTRTQKILPGNPESGGITSLALSKSRKYLAVAEWAEKAFVTIYDLQTLKKRKILVSSVAGSQEYVSVAFSPDEKYLITQGGAPDWDLVLWLWEKGKLLFSSRTTNQQGNPVHQCVFHPSPEMDLISVVGNGIFKTFRVVDQALKSQPASLAKREPHNYTAHAWIAEGERDRLLVGSEQGELMIMEAGELKQLFTMPDNHGIFSVVVYSKGFIVGGSAGQVWLYERQDSDKEPYRLTRTFAIPNEPGNVKDMSVSPGEEYLAVTTSTHQAYSMALANTELMKADDLGFELLASSFHHGAITGLDTCIRKPLVASCSADRTVRIWNHVDRTCELSRQFVEEPFSVAIHPSGYLLLVGFADKLRLMTVLMDDLRVIKEIAIKSCRECQFSSGGQYFAAVNGSTVHIYSTYTGENLGNLRGHNGKVASVQWTAEDSRLVSTGSDGAVYEWTLKDFRRLTENVQKGVHYHCVLATPDSKHFWAVGSDKKLKEFVGEEGTGSATIAKDFDSDENLTQLALPQGTRTLFSATDSGIVRSYRYPLSGEYVDTKVHAGPITRIRLTSDSSVLFCASADGTLSVLEIKDKDPERAAAERKDALPWAEEVLVTKSELEERRHMMLELENKVNENYMQYEYQIRMKDMAMQEEIKKLTAKFSDEVERDRENFEKLLQEKNEMEMEYEDKLKQAEELRQQQLQALDAQFQQKIMVEVERYQQLSQEKDLLNERWEEQNAALVESHERVVQELTEEYEAKLQEEQMNSDRLQQEKEDMAREFEEIRRQMEEDTDREIEGLKEKYEQKLGMEREISLRLKGENGIMKKKFHALQKDIEDKKEEIRQLFEKEKDLYATITSLEKDIVGLKKEIRERDETIGDKEKRIYDLKKKNQELEKFKFVLDYKIKELKKQIEPREAEIARMRDQTREMDHELERYHKQNGSLELAISELKLRVQALQGEVLQQRTKLGDARVYVKRFRHDLHDCVQHVQEPKVLKEKVKALYHIHVGSEEIEEVEVDMQVEGEHERQRSYLENTVESLKRKLQKESDKARQDSMRIMQENVALIKEINELRREIKGLRMGQSAQSTAPGGGRASGLDSAYRSGRISKENSRGSRNGLHAPSPSAATREIEMQREVISQLRQELAQHQRALAEAQAGPRPGSRQAPLPPLEGEASGAPPEEGPEGPVAEESGGGAEDVGGDGGEEGGAVAEESSMPEAEELEAGGE
ncbi:unnamed protein product [Pedinophyceae sp. YPF-701]|nr:unnamed protein product [Pedinophyceae sp. YPF-701]